MLVELNWGGFVVVPTFNLDVAVGAIRDGVIEPWTTELVSQIVKPNDKVVNVGANFGYYTSLLGRLIGIGGRCISIEANPFLLNYLVKSVYYNGTPNQTQIHSFAAGENSGKTLLQFGTAFIGGGGVINATIQDFKSIEQSIWTLSDMSDLTRNDAYQWFPGDRQISIEVPLKTVDEICDNELDFGLFDVEGSEPFVLLGMEKSIRRSKNFKFIAEWSPAYLSRGNDYLNAVNKMLELLTSLNFKFQHVNPSGYPHWTLGPKTKPELLHDQPTGDYLWTRD
jgi:FkbM family methyltransferase